MYRRRLHWTQLVLWCAVLCFLASVLKVLVKLPAIVLLQWRAVCRIVAPFAEMLLLCSSDVSCCVACCSTFVSHIAYITCFLLFPDVPFTNIQCRHLPWWPIFSLKFNNFRNLIILIFYFFVLFSDQITIVTKTFLISSETHRTSMYTGDLSIFFSIIPYTYNYEVLRSKNIYTF